MLYYTNHKQFTITVMKHVHYAVTVAAMGI